MLIYRPVKTNILTQGFGANLACVYPGTYKVVGKYGNTCPGNSVEFYPTIGLDGHNGYDLATVDKENVYFNVVADTKWRTTSEVDTAGGIVLNVFSIDPIKVPEPEGEIARDLWGKQGGKLHVRFIYVHAKQNIDRPDKAVTPGAHIQVADSTGASGGNHVHFGFKYVDMNGDSLDRTNGYMGYVDPTPFYRNQFILDALTEKAFLEAQIGSLAELHRQLEAAKAGFKESISQKIQRILLIIRVFFNRK